MCTFTDSFRISSRIQYIAHRVIPQPHLLKKKKANDDSNRLWQSLMTSCCNGMPATYEREYLFIRLRYPSSRALQNATCRIAATCSCTRRKFHAIVTSTSRGVAVSSFLPIRGRRWNVEVEAAAAAEGRRRRPAPPRGRRGTARRQTKVLPGVGFALSSRLYSRRTDSRVARLAGFTAAVLPRFRLRLTCLSVRRSVSQSAGTPSRAFPPDRRPPAGRQGEPTGRRPTPRQVGPSTTVCRPVCGEGLRGAAVVVSRRRSDRARSPIVNQLVSIDFLSVTATARRQT